MKGTIPVLGETDILIMRVRESRAKNTPLTNIATSSLFTDPNPNPYALLIIHEFILFCLKGKKLPALVTSLSLISLRGSHIYLYAYVIIIACFSLIILSFITRTLSQDLEG